MGLLSNPNVGSTTAGVYATILKQLETGGQGQFVSSFGSQADNGHIIRYILTHWTTETKAEQAFAVFLRQ